MRYFAFTAATCLILATVAYAACDHNNPARDTCGASCNCGCVPGGLSVYRSQTIYQSQPYAVRRELRTQRRHVTRYRTLRQAAYEPQWFDVGEQSNRFSFSLLSVF